MGLANDNQDENTLVGAGCAEGAVTSTNPRPLSPIPGICCAAAERTTWATTADLGSLGRIGFGLASLALLTPNVERQLSAQVIEHRAHSRGGAQVPVHH